MTISELSRLLVTEYGVDEAAISLDARLGDDLLLDSLEIMELTHRAGADTALARPMSVSELLALFRLPGVLGERSP